MPLPQDVANQRQLVYVKLLFQQAAVHARRSYNPIDRTMAVIGFDHANETLLKLLHLDLTGRRSDQKSFPDLLKDVQSEFKRKALSWPANIGDIKHVRSIRNGAQHEARFPSEDDVRQCHVYTQDFLAGMYTAAWDLAFDAIDMTIFVDDPKLRSLCELSHECISAGDYEASVIIARIVFRLALNSAAELDSDDDYLSLIPWYLRQAGRVDSWTESQARDPRVTSLLDSLEKIGASVRTAFDLLNERMFIFTTGVPVVNYRTFVAACGGFSLWFSSDMHPRVDIVEGFQPQLDDAERTIGFVIDTTIQWQAQGLAPKVPEEARDAMQELIETKAVAFRHTRLSPQG